MPREVSSRNIFVSEAVAGAATPACGGTMVTPSMLAFVTRIQVGTMQRPNERRDRGLEARNGGPGWRVTVTLKREHRWFSFVP